MIIHFVQKIFEKRLVIVYVYLYCNFELCHMTAEMSCLDGFNKVISIGNHMYLCTIKE